MWSRRNLPVQFLLGADVVVQRATLDPGSVTDLGDAGAVEFCAIDRVVSSREYRIRQLGE